MTRHSTLLATLAIATCFLLAAGCNPSADEPAPGAGTGAPGSGPAGDHAPHAEHADHGAGPHGGVVADWGGGAYHVEFTVDHDHSQATVYILGSDEQSPAPIPADMIQLAIDDPPTELQLAAKPLAGEAPGMSSRFVGSHDTLGIVREFSGEISGQIDGTPYAGEFSEKPHVPHAE